MNFYDTMAREIRTFEPITKGQVSIYTCGPTVYRSSHIGNLRTYITADLLRRALEFAGLKVRQITNITDVGHMTDDQNETGEDKMLLAAEDEGLTPAEISGKYTAEFLEHIDAVNVQRSQLYPRATDHIPEMIEISAKLIEKGHAYEVNGTVYFDVGSFPDYGKLSHNTIDKLQGGHRLIELDPAKAHSYDFTLWRAAGPNRSMKWSSPWGDGYPGWHIECSAMSIKHLGETFDIHTGGSDNIFPHHEDEIAQSEGFLGHRVVNHWFHGHHLLAQGRKMAKSANNYYTIDDIIDRGFDPLAFRFLVMQSRYRSQENFTWEALDSAQRGLNNLRRQKEQWGAPATDLIEPARSLDGSFRNSIADDIDTPSALSILSQVVSANIPDDQKARLLTDWDLILGLDLSRHISTQGELPKGAGELIEAREHARAANDFNEADRLREQLAQLGVELMDTADGTHWRVSKPQ